MTSPLAINFSGVEEIPMVAMVFSSLASAICEAMALFQISSYKRCSFLSPEIPCVEKSVGLMASWASWAPSVLVVNFLD